jgi:hypothetical protein
MTLRDWQNGMSCLEHGLPYCTPCFQALLKDGPNPAKPNLSEVNDIVARMRSKLRQRFEVQHKFAMHVRIQKADYLLPLDFVIIGDNERAYRADNTETRSIMYAVDKWNDAPPAWMQNFTPAFSEEDEKLLREMQLFAKG